MDFHSKTVKETAKILGTSLTKGLEPNEVVNRLKSTDCIGDISF